jgi:5-dehydro-2-deoxygluconokinase
LSCWISTTAHSWVNDAEAAAEYANFASKSDIVVGNDDEFGLLAGGHANGESFARHLTQNQTMVAIYKMGAAGAVTYTPDFSFRTGIFAVNALKPMGAGDGFMGGLLAALAQQNPLETAVRRGAATAAMIVAGIGCAPASPDRMALDDFIASY